MRRLVRVAIVTAAAGVCLAGPIAAAVLALSPPAWRGPALAWVILGGSLAIVARFRRRRGTRP
jgi:peptidoglycan/LPS O-acetylase OafA/YrhL